MYARRAIVVPPVNRNKKSCYKFNINDPVFCTSKKITDPKVLSRYEVNGGNFYKIGNGTDTEICKESELIHR